MCRSSGTCSYVLNGFICSYVFTGFFFYVLCGLYSYILIICTMSIIIIICDMPMIIILAMSSIPIWLLTIIIYCWSLTIIINLLLTINNNRNESYKHKLISTIILNQNKHNFIIPALLDDLPVILIIFCQVLCP